MKFDANLIDELASKQVVGAISQEEADKLNELISGDKDAYAYWKSVSDYYQKANIQEVNRNFDENVSLDNVWNTISHIRKVRIRRRNYSIAAISIVAIGMLVYILFPERATDRNMVQNTPPVGIQLTVPGGNTIDLSTTKGEVTVAGATLQNSNKVLRYTPTHTPEPGTLATLTVPVGRDYMVQLSDGSQIWLNSATSLKFPFSFGESREITINGEAYIRVAPNAEKPFLVHLPGSTVQVLGTEFNVNSYDSGVVRVALVKGAVKLQAPERSKVIKPGFEAVFKKGAQIETHLFDEDYTLSWRGGIFKFSNTSLEEICRVLPRWFGVEVVMDNRQIANLQITGKLDRNKSLEKQLQLFKNATDLDYYFRDGVLHFR